MATAKTRARTATIVPSLPKGPKVAKPRGRKRRTVLSRQQLLTVAGPGELPLEFLLKTMRDPNTDQKRRDWAAQTAAPYVHPRLSSVEVVRNMNDAELDALLVASAQAAGVTIDLQQLGITAPGGVPTFGVAPVAPALPAPVTINAPPVLEVPKRKVPKPA